MTCMLTVAVVLLILYSIFVQIHVGELEQSEKKAKGQLADANRSLEIERAVYKKLELDIVRLTRERDESRVMSETLRQHLGHSQRMNANLLIKMNEIQCIIDGEGKPCTQPS